MPRISHEVSRLEGFSDAVFGFALTLLVVSLEVPSSFEALESQMEGFLGFALMFAMVCWIWYEHNWFFRRTGLQDPWTVFLNSVLLFVVLFYVYPMKFLTGALMFEFFGLGGADTPRISSAGHGATLMLLYSIGVVLIFGTFLLLYRHAWRRRSEIALAPSDALTLEFGRRSHLISMSVGLLSIVLALALPSLPALAGMIYFLMGPLHGWNGYQAGKAQATLAAETVTSGETSGGAGPDA